MGFLQNQFNNQKYNVKAYPTLGAGITLTSSATAFTLGDFIEVLPSNITTKPFSIDCINFAAYSTPSLTYECYLYYGESGEEVNFANLRVNSGSGTTNPHVPVKSQVFPAGTRITAKFASPSTGAKTAITSIFYKED